MNGILHDPFGHFHMGITAENVAARYGISREMQDSLSVTSQQRAAHAIAEGRFKSQIIPIEIPSKKGPSLFEIDEHVRGSVTLEQLAKMKPAFKKDGVVTAGNASGLNDGASAVILAGSDKAKHLGLSPLARLVLCSRGSRPRLYGHGAGAGRNACTEACGT